jgi:hypothetical protein
MFHLASLSNAPRLTIVARRTLHSVGAAIILLTLPLDLFFQQIVAYPTVWIQAGLNAPLQRATIYNPIPSITEFNGSMFSFADQNMFTFEESYFIRDPIPFGYDPGCPTSNCTWEPFDTLGLCSSCTEAPSELQFGCQMSAGDWLPDISPAEQNSPNVTACGWFLNPPNGMPILMTGYWQNSSGPQDGLATRLLPLTDAITYQPVVPDGSIYFKNVSNAIVDFLAASLPSGIAGAYRNETPAVQECEVHWCVKTMQAQFTLGNYTEVITKEVPLNTNDAAAPWAFPAPYHYHYLPEFNLTVSDLQSPTGYTDFGLNNLTARQAVQALFSFIPAVWVAPSETAPLQVKWQWAADPPTVYTDSGNTWGKSGDRSDVLDSLSTTLTNLARITRNQYTGQLSYVNGTSWKQVTHVHTRWEWVTLPLALLLFSLVFLISVVWQSSKQDQSIGIWKTSALAVLFNGLGEEIQETIGPKVRIGDARSRAQKLTVRLEE